MIGDFSKVILQERVKNNSNQLCANIYNRLLPKHRLIHNLPLAFVGFYRKMTLHTPHYHWDYLLFYTTICSRVFQLYLGYLRLNFDSVESRMGRWYYERSKQTCERSEHIAAKFGAQRQFFASNHYNPCSHNSNYNQFIQ